MHLRHNTRVRTQLNWTGALHCTWPVGTAKLNSAWKHCVGRFPWVRLGRWALAKLNLSWKHLSSIGACPLIHGLKQLRPTASGGSLILGVIDRTDSSYLLAKHMQSAPSVRQKNNYLSSGVLHICGNQFKVVLSW